MILPLHAFHFSRIARSQFVENSQILAISLHLCIVSATEHVGRFLFQRSPLRDLNSLRERIRLLKLISAFILDIRPLPVSSLISCDLPRQFLLITCLPTLAASVAYTFVSCELLLVSRCFSRYMVRVCVLEFTYSYLMCLISR